MSGNGRGARGLSKVVMTAVGAGIFLAAGWVVSLMYPSQDGAPVRPLLAQKGQEQRAPKASNKRKKASEAQPEVPASGVPGLPHAANLPTPEGGAEAKLEAATLPTPRNWYLYITGSVRNPGVYQLPPDSRLFHLVEAAGGFDGFADRTAVNLAALLADGLHIHVPRKGEDKKGSAHAPQSSPMVIVSAPAPNQSLGFQAPSAAIPRPGQTLRQAQTPAGRIDINRAPAAELTRLRGIGPALAQRIVEYRQQHGPFRSVDDLAQVRGIGAAKLKGLRDQAFVAP